MADAEIVKELKALLRASAKTKADLEASIKKAQLVGVMSLGAYYDFLNEMARLIPRSRDILHHLLEFYYLVGQDEDLKRDNLFQQWVVKFAESWGSFLDTTESAARLSTFYTDPAYHIDDYMVSPSGWLTFNQFFARHVRPGARPVDGLRDDTVVVSPADSVFMGSWPIDRDSQVTVKGLKWSVIELLDGSPYQDAFRGGRFMHAFLNVNDYHRYHVPVRGRVKEVRKIPGKAVLDVIKKDDGSLDVVDGVGYQFTQDRGLIIQDSPVGLVATLPIGMAQVSSCNLTAQAGAVLRKGEEFGYFSFGGSDIIVMFEQIADVSLTAEVGVHYKQGETIGKVEVLAR